jgi:hypothetical protein
MLQRYRGLLQTCVDAGVSFTLDFQDEITFSKTQAPILRHDVDFSWTGILEMAELEASFSQQAIYLFRPDSIHYNLESRSVLKVINEVSDFGHAIGLHLDRRTTNRSKESLLGFSEYLHYVKSRFPMMSCYMSWHRPFPEDLGVSEDFEGLISLYASKYWSPNTYLSDAAGIWDATKSETLHKFLASKSFFQLLIHPEWWISSSISESFGVSYGTQILESLNSLQQEIRTFEELKLRFEIVKQLD